MFLVAGVSGKTGSVVADRLLNAGKAVRVLVRSAAKGEPWRARGAEVAVASMDDEAALVAALTGTEGAYLLYPAELGAPDPLSAAWRTADAIARAVERTRLPHLVFLSSMGAEQPEGTGIVRGLHAAEVRLREIKVPITFLRPSYFLEEWLQVLGVAAGEGKLPTFIPPDRTLAMPSVRDIGAVAAQALLDGPRAQRDVIEIRGARDYSPRDLAALLSGVLARPVVLDPAPLEALVPMLLGFGASPAFAELVREMYAAIGAGSIGAGTGERSIRGTTSAEDVFRDALATLPS